METVPWTEMTMDQRQAFMAAERSKEEREAVANFAIEGLVEQWEGVQSATQERKLAVEAEALSKRQYADSLAAAFKISQGTRVYTENRRHKRGTYTKVQVRIEYEVTRWVFYGATSLCLYGRTIRKDGTLGELREIGTSWRKA